MTSASTSGPLTSTRCANAGALMFGATPPKGLTKDIIARMIAYREHANPHTLTRQKRSRRWLVSRSDALEDDTGNNSHSESEGQGHQDEQRHEG
jgi:hypothetical protein